MERSFNEPTTSSRALRIAGRVSAYVIVALGAVVMIAPFLWMLSTAFKGGGAVCDYPPSWIPSPLTFENFHEVWTVVPFGRYLFNSLFIEVCVTAGEVLTSALAAYAFARLRFPGRDTLFLMYLATLMIPGQVTIIPNFILMRYLGWINP